MSFANLKKQSGLGSLTSKLVKEVEKMNNTGGGGDDRLWKPEVDKTGNGFAVIRFLPAPDGEELPWADVHSCFPKHWWMVHRKLPDNHWSERPCFRAQQSTLELWC